LAASDRATGHDHPAETAAHQPPRAAAPADPSAELRLRRERLAVERGELVYAEAAARAWAKALEELLGAVELFVVELPMRLADLTGREAADAGRRPWWEFRPGKPHSCESSPRRAAPQREGRRL
jgi:hypothetical protein